VRRTSVLAIVQATTWDAVLGAPRAGGLLDPRLGPALTDARCETCAGDYATCVGHLGHLELPAPVYTPTSAAAMYATLRAFCVHCGELLVPASARTRLGALLGRETSALGVLKALHKAAGKACGACARTQPVFANKASASKQWATGDGGNDWFPFTALLPGAAEPLAVTGARARVVLDRLLGAERSLAWLAAHTAGSLWDVSVLHDAEDAGDAVERSTAHWRRFFDALVTDALPVLPPCARPTLRQSRTTANSLGVSLHDYTCKYEYILAEAIELRRFMKSLGVPARLPSFGYMSNDVRHANAWYARLQFYVDALVDGASSTPPPAKVTRHRLKALKTQRALGPSLRKKEGRMRSNLMGKRTNFAARTVITPDPNVPIGWVGVPPSVAEVLTVPERVTPFNVEVLAAEAAVRVTNRASTRSIFEADGSGQHDLREGAVPGVPPVRPALGQIVERRLRTGDLVLLNRQPSLHSASIQAKRIVVLPGSSFRLPPNVTGAFNADFDGDEVRYTCFNCPFRSTGTPGKFSESHVSTDIIVSCVVVGMLSNARYSKCATELVRCIFFHFHDD